MTNPENGFLTGRAGDNKVLSVVRLSFFLEYPPRIVVNRREGSEVTVSLPLS